MTLSVLFAAGLLAMILAYFVASRLTNLKLRRDIEMTLDGWLVMAAVAAFAYIALVYAAPLVDQGIRSTCRAVLASPEYKLK